MTDSTDSTSWRSRLLRIAGDVRRGEESTLLLLCTNVFLLMLAYYVLKTVREGLVVSRSFFGIRGDEFKIYATGAMSVLLIGVVRLYDTIATGSTRMRLIRVTMAGIIACLIAFFALGSLGYSVSLAYLVWLGIVNFLLVAQFWSFANDVYSEAQGKRLFAVVAVGASLGSLLGPGLVAVFKNHPFALMLVAAAMFAVCGGLYGIVDRRERLADQEQPAGRKDDGEEIESIDDPIADGGGFRLVWQSRYLLLIALLVLLANLVNTTGEYILANGAREVADAVVPDAAAQHLDAPLRGPFLSSRRGAVINEFYGSFYSTVNLAALLIQLLLVSRILKFFGVRRALFFLPLVAFGGYALIAVLGGVGVLRLAKTAENSTDYSLQNTVRHALFLPTSRTAKYKAKAAIDTFVVRCGDTLAATLVVVGVHLLAFGPWSFAMVNMAIIAGWLVVCALIASEHRKIATEP